MNLRRQERDQLLLEIERRCDEELALCSDTADGDRGRVSVLNSCGQAIAELMRTHGASGELENLAFDKYRKALAIQNDDTEVM